MKSFYRKSIDLFSSYPDLIFFFSFLFTFPFTIRKVIFSFGINGSFNEFSSGYIYLSDVFLLLTFIGYFILIIGKKVKRVLLYSDTLSLYIPLLLLFSVYSFASIFWSQYSSLTLYRSLRILFFGILFIYTIKRFRSIEYLDRVLLSKISYAILFFTSLLNSFISIFQFVTQKSIGLYFLGESYLAPNLAGVAKLTAFGHKFIRSYVIFPHPNILGGFLLFSIIISYFFIQSSISAKVMQSRWFGWLFRISIFIQMVALFFTFSKTAYIGLIIFGSYFLLQRLCAIKIRYFQTFCRLFFKYYAFFVSSSILVVFIYTSFYSVNIAGVINKSLNERQLYIHIAYNVIRSHSIIGIGSGQFVAEMANYSDVPVRSWEFQPVHNIFLLIWAELGMLGFLLFSGILYFSSFKCSTWNKICSSWKHVFQLSGHKTDAKQSSLLKAVKSKEIKNVPRGTFNYSILMFSFLPAIFFDHYLWDIYPGLILLCFILIIAFLGRAEVRD